MKEEARKKEEARLPSLKFIKALETSPVFSDYDPSDGYTKVIQRYYEYQGPITSRMKMSETQQV